MLSKSTDFYSLLLNERKSSLLDALVVIQNSKEKTALIVDDSQKLIGMVSDGDIRRSLLAGNSLDSIVSKSIKKGFISIEQSSNDLLLKATHIIKRNGIRQLPVINKDGEIVDLYFIDESITALPNTVVLMAGGKGKRLRPHTSNCPKPMIRIGGKPMLEIILENCICNGLYNFYISVNYLKEQVIDYFKDGSEWGVTINYLIEEEPLGTAGALSLLPGDLKDPFIVINGDILTKLNPNELIYFHNDHNNLATICVRNHSVSIPFGVVETNDFDLVSFQEKPTFNYLINAGVYVLNPSIINMISKNRFIDMPSLLEVVKNSGKKVSVCPIHEYWIDIGNPESLERAQSSWGVES